MKPNPEVDRLFVHRIALANGTVRDNSSEDGLGGRLCCSPQARIIAVLTLIFLMPTSVWAVSAKVIESNGWSGSILFWSAAVLLALVATVLALYFYRKNRELKEAMSRLRDLKNQSLPESEPASPLGDATAASAPSPEIELPDDKTVSRKSAQVQKAQPPVLEIPLPKPTQALHKAIARGRCIAVVGSGMNAQHGLMTWTEMLESVVSKSFDHKTAKYYQHNLAGGRVDLVAESLRSEMGPDALAEHISTLVPKEFQDAYEQMRAVKFAGIINLNFDTLSSNALPSTSVWSHNEARSCLDHLSRGEPFVIQLNGTVGAGDMLFSNQDLQDVVAQNAPLRDLLRRLYYSHTLLFLGVSLAGVQNFFRLIDRLSQESGHHFALIEAVDESYIYMSKNLSQFGITLMPFGVQDRSVAIRDFLSELETAGDIEDQLIEDETISKISRVELRNIGPFAKEIFEFDADCNVILGDNGVGKSTILKAIAVCACGEESAGYADRLLRKGATIGEIILHMGSRKYVTIIEEKTDGGVTVQSVSGVPYQLENMLIVGFSALRSIGWERPKDRGQPGAARPISDDIMPLITGERDPRLDGIKQLILRLHHSVESKDTPAADQKRYRALFNQMLSMFKDLAHGVEISLGKVDAQASEIEIVTQDGPVPLESLSQGTLSLISWTGALLQRLFETTRQDTNPMKTAAIVLIDEIDAHMHPAWQRSLVGRLRNTFPNVQFIATSHSPLMVGGLEPDQVYRLLRNKDGSVIKERPDYALKGLGVAGLLTSNLFGLDTHLDEETEKALARKRVLAGKAIDGTIEEAEEAELARLDQEVGDIDYTRARRDPTYKSSVENAVEDSTSIDKDQPDASAEEDRREREKILHKSLTQILKGEADR